jgi:hypothetical protein
VCGNNSVPHRYEKPVPYYSHNAEYSDFFVLLSSVRIMYKTIVLRACVKLMEINKNPL